MSMVSLVKGCPLFFEIYDSEIEDIIKECVVASYDVGDYIITQGDSSSDICILLEGVADITVNTPGGDHYIASINSGDIFGELVLINETNRTANIIAKEKCDVLILSYEDFYSFYNKNPKIFALMVLNVTRLITKRLKNSNQVIEKLNKTIMEIEDKKAA